MAIPIIEKKLNHPISDYTVEELTEVLAESLALQNMLCVDFEDFLHGPVQQQFFAPQHPSTPLAHFTVPLHSEIVVKPSLTPVKKDKHLLLVARGDIHINLTRFASRIDLHISGQISNLTASGNAAMQIAIPPSVEGAITRIKIVGDNLTYLFIQGYEIYIAKLCYLPQL
jgi:hypothetical protein